jgi:hypothetical protein
MDALKAEGVAHVVVDAVADEISRDRRGLPGHAAAHRRQRGRHAAAGDLAARGAAVARGRSAGAAATDEPRAIVLSGSCSAMTNRQVAAYRAGAGAPTAARPVTLAEHGPGAALDWLAAQPEDADAADLRHRRARRRARRAGEARRGAAGALVEQRAGRLRRGGARPRRAALRRGGRRDLGPVTQALGVTRLDIGAEIAPGVPWTFAESGGPRDRDHAQIRQFRRRELLRRRAGGWSHERGDGAARTDLPAGEVDVRPRADRRLTGNISARTEDGGLLVSPTGSCFGRLDPARLSRFDATGRLIGGDPPTKEMPLHSAFYDTRGTRGRWCICIPAIRSRCR